MRNKSAHFIPTNEAPDIFSKTSNEVSTASFFPPEDPLLFEFNFFESTDPFGTLSFGFSLGRADNRDSATT